MNRFVEILNSKHSDNSRIMMTSANIEYAIDTTIQCSQHVLQYQLGIQIVLNQEQ